MADSSPTEVEAIVEKLARRLNRIYSPEMYDGDVDWSDHTADDREAFRVDARTLLDELDGRALAALSALRDRPLEGEGGP